MTKYVVYTEVIFDALDKGIERWYYGTWSDRDTANEVALKLGVQYEDDARYYHCVCSKEDAVKLGIKNLPLNF